MMRSEVIKMELVILTNNEKVLSEAFKYATVKYRRATAVDIVLEARYLAQKGGKLAADMMKVPTKSFFRSIPMLIGGNEPYEKTIKSIDRMLNRMVVEPCIYTNLPKKADKHARKDCNALMKIFT